MKTAFRRNYILWLAAFAATSVLLSSCHGMPTCEVAGPEVSPLEYVRVDYAASYDELERVRGEVFASEVFKANHPEYKTVAIRVPESCLDETAGQKEGQTAGKVVLNTTCGAYFSELEKSLVKKGYRVISWDRIKNTYEIALELGADIVFMVNSLETSDARLGSESKVSYKFFHARPDGSVVEPANMDSASRNVFKAFVDQKTAGGPGGPDGISILSSIMDVTAITAASGETVWFYNKTTYEHAELSQSHEQKFLFEGRDGEWWPKWPDGLEIPKVDNATLEPNQYSSEEEYSSRTESTDHQQERDRRELALIREVVTDFVDAFSTPNAEGSN